MAVTAAFPLLTALIALQLWNFLTSSTFTACYCLWPVETWGTGCVSLLTTALGIHSCAIARYYVLVCLLSVYFTYVPAVGQQIGYCLYYCYFDSWLHTVHCYNCVSLQRWVRAFHDDIVHARITTTNGLERQHEELKYNYLSNASNGSLTDLVTTVVKKFVPQSQTKYAGFLAQTCTCCVYLYDDVNNGVPGSQQCLAKELLRKMLLNR